MYNLFNRKSKSAKNTVDLPEKTRDCIQKGEDGYGIIGDEFGIYSDKRIYITNDYSKFKQLKSDRPVSYSNEINEVIKSIPIIINEKGEVIGKSSRSRLETLKELGMPIPYVVEIGAVIENCTTLDTNGKELGSCEELDNCKESDNCEELGNNTKLEKMDYVNMYSTDKTCKNMDSYIRFKSLYEQFSNIPVTVIQESINSKYKTGNDIKEGKLQVSEDAYLKSKKCLSYISEFDKDLQGNAAYKRSRVSILKVCVLCYASKSVDNNRLKDRVIESLTGDTDLKLSNMEEVVKYFEKVYNKRIPNEDRIYLDKEYDARHYGKKRRDTHKCLERKEQQKGTKETTSKKTYDNQQKLF